MLQGYTAASPQARGTRGSAGVTGCLGFRRVMPGAFLSLPQVLPELRARFAAWRGLLGAPARRDARTHSRPELKGRQDFLCRF